MLAWAVMLAALLSPSADTALSRDALLAGQDLIYQGQYSAAALYFTRLAAAHPEAPAPPALHASALIWWGEAQKDESFAADSIDGLLDEAIRLAVARDSLAASDSERVAALFWLGTAYGYRARQAEAHGAFWRATRDARAMRSAIQRAVALDSTCVDCLLPLGVYDYGLARVSTIAKLVAKIIGLGGGDWARGMERVRLASEQGTFTRTEARWVYANMLEREGGSDRSLREEARRMVGDLVERYPENLVFRRFLETRRPSAP